MMYEPDRPKERKYGLDKGLHHDLQGPWAVTEKLVQGHYMHTLYLKALWVQYEPDWANGRENMVGTTILQ